VCELAIIVGELTRVRADLCASRLVCDLYCLRVDSSASRLVRDLAVRELVCQRVVQ